MKIRILAVALLGAGGAPAFALADDARLLSEAVRVQFGGDRAHAVTGKIIRLDRCLYVRLDAARDGITLVRMDQVTRLEVKNGAAWVARDVRGVLSREPSHCSAEANG